MSAVLDQMYAEASEVFGIDGIGSVIYPNKSAWMGLIALWRGKAKTQLTRFIDEKDWDGLTAASAKSAESDMLTVISDSAGEVLSWVKQNLLGEPAAEVRESVLKTFLMAQYAKAATSLELHENGSMQDAIDDGTITEADARTNLDQAVRVMEMIAKAGAAGAFPNSTTQEFSLGIALPVVAIIAVVVAGAIVAMWYIYRTTAMTERIAMAALARCDKLLAAGEHEAYAQCIKGVQQNVPGSDLMKPLSDATKILAVGLAAAGLVWVGVKVVLPAFDKRAGA